jgi:hypothetical protein
LTDVQSSPHVDNVDSEWLNRQVSRNPASTKTPALANPFEARAPARAVIGPVVSLVRLDQILEGLQGKDLDHLASRLCLDHDRLLGSRVEPGSSLGGGLVNDLDLE